MIIKDASHTWSILLWLVNIISALNMPTCRRFNSVFWNIKAITTKYALSIDCWFYPMFHTKHVTIRLSVLNSSLRTTLNLSDSLQRFFWIAKKKIGYWLAGFHEEIYAIQYGYLLTAKSVIAIRRMIILDTHSLDIIVQ